MQRTDFHYDLPENLIAQYPTAQRTASRLLHLPAPPATLSDLHFHDLPNLLQAGDLLVLNDTRVIPARLFGRKSSGGNVEIMVERVLDPQRVLAQLRASKSPAIGSDMTLENGTCVTVVARPKPFYELRFTCDDVTALLHAVGHIPLPPYIKRNDNDFDHGRYQTIFAQRDGAVAAPTAGLHFDQAMLDQLAAQGVKQAYVTLHVGAGTFSPVREDDVSQHVMHSEIVDVNATVCEQIAATKAQGGRVVAVGTTCVRALETAAQNGVLQPYCGETRLFILPGYRFKVVDALVTNFHLPESTLLMLVAAFAGQERVLAAYQHAVTQQYRFFSYGDAMFISRYTPLTDF